MVSLLIKKACFFIDILFFSFKIHTSKNFILSYCLDLIMHLIISLELKRIVKKYIAFTKLVSCPSCCQPFVLDIHVLSQDFDF